MLLLLIGAVAAITGASWGIVLLLVGLAGVVGTHVLVGIRAYRRVMRRPWPKVKPLEDDDDW
jgi:membrane protein DedA with SNARE-associated domain